MGFFGKLFGGGAGKGAELLQNINADLNLSADQLAQLKNFFKEFREQKQAAKADGSFESKIAGIRQSFKERLNGVLTPEQQQKFAAGIEKYRHIFHGD